MSKPSRKAPTKVASGKVKVTVADQPSLPRRKQGGGLLSTTILLSAIGLVVGGGWLAVKLIVNPDSLEWLTWILPEWGISAEATAPQTLNEIEAEVTKAGRFMGKPIHLSTYPGLSSQAIGFHDFLLPIFEPRHHCDQVTAATASQPTACGQMVELRAYRPQTTFHTTFHNLGSKEPAFEQIERINVTGPEEMTAIAPLTESAVASQGSTRKLPLTQLTFIAGNAPLLGVWMHLSGQWKRGNQVTYGQVVYYNPAQKRLHVLLSWTTPTAQLPRWQQVTGSDQTELVVDQTLGLEPQYQVYQVNVLNSPARPVAVEAITLTAPALNDRTYGQGILLARNGLWSDGLKLLQNAKQRVSSAWSEEAQSQMDLIALHATVTQAQADRDWASPTQQIVTQLLDGRWSKALQLLQKAHQNGYETRSLLSVNSDRLWRRVETAIRINSHQADAQRWGVLILAVQKNRQEAIQWLRRHQTAKNAGKEPIAQILALLDPLPIASLSPDQKSATLAAHPTPPSHPLTLSPPPSSPRLIGTATPIYAIRAADWLTPNSTSSLKLNNGQAWYQVEVAGFQVGEQWQRSMPAELISSNSNSSNSNSSNSNNSKAQAIWQQLGLLNDSQIQLFNWTGKSASQTLQATVWAVQFKDGVLHLLVAGDASLDGQANPLLAITTATVSWLEPLQTLAVADLEQQPDWINTFSPALEQELGHSGEFAAMKSAAQMQAIGNWTVRLMELTGDNSPEAVLTFQNTAQSISDLSSSNSISVNSIPSGSEAFDSGDATHPQTIILSRQGTVLYSDLGGQQDRSLVAIVHLEDSSLEDSSVPILIVGDSQGYWIERWSGQGFE